MSLRRQVAAELRALRARLVALNDAATPPPHIVRYILDGPDWSARRALVRLPDRAQSIACTLADDGRAVLADYRDGRGPVPLSDAERTALGVVLPQPPPPGTTPRANP